jgi:hypothetical protein
VTASKWTAADMPDQGGKTALVTGKFLPRLCLSSARSGYARIHTKRGGGGRARRTGRQVHRSRVREVDGVARGLHAPVRRRTCG